MNENKNDDNNLEINLGSLTIVEKQYNSDDFNSLEQIEKIDDHFGEETHVISNFNNNEKLSTKEDQTATIPEDCPTDSKTKNNFEEEEKCFKQKLVEWLKDNDLKLSPKFPLTIASSSNVVTNGISGNTGQGLLGDTSLQRSFFVGM